MGRKVADTKKVEENNNRRDGAIDSVEFFEALEQISREADISKERLYTAIESALVTALKKNIGRSANIRVLIDPSQRKVDVFSHKKVVDEVNDEISQISLADARSIQTRYELGDLVEIPVTLHNFGYSAAQTGKQVVVQALRSARNKQAADATSQKENELLTAIVSRVENGRVYVSLGKVEGVIEQDQQIPNETLSVGDRVKVYVLSVLRSSRGPQIRVSRTDPGLVKRLFELEVPEISNGTVQIKGIIREAGYRTKMAVHSTDDTVDAVGSCVGPRGMRVENVVAELGMEKIDIIEWSSDPEVFIANALSPARVEFVRINEEERAAHVIVPDNQLSLAIGKEGQNSRLAHKLTNWKIDICSRSQDFGNTVEHDSAPDAEPAEPAETTETEKPQEE